MTDTPESHSNHPAFILPRGWRWGVLGGLAAGLIAFILVWIGQRDTSFFQVTQTDKGQTAASGSGLPVPTGDSSPVDMPPAGQPVEPSASIDPETSSETAPQPLDEIEETATPPASDIPESIELPPQRVIELSPAPEYPPNALRDGISGSVLLDVLVGLDGHPIRVNIARRSGTRELDRAAQRAVEQWQFTPATRNGQPVPGQIQIPIDFAP